MRALVAGLGVSGVAAARALLAAGADVRAGDGADTPALRARAADLAAAGADVRLGDLGPALLSGRDVVVPSPGIPPHAPLLAAAVADGVAVWSEPELAWRLAGGSTRLVAVTGTNGKTTTAQLLAACLGAPAAGNIGTPLVEVLAAQPPPLVVAELSSFQLHFAATLRPAVAVLLNVAPDHLDWHGGLDAYGASKAQLWACQEPGDWAVLNRDDAGVRRVAAAAPPPAGCTETTIAGPSPAAGGVGIVDGWISWRAPGVRDAVPVVAVDRLHLPGAHNLANVCAAVAGAACAGADARGLGEPLAAFRPGAHRLEHVATVDGVAWVNDSKATNPHAAAAALSSYDSVVWIAGGLNKGLDFDALTDVVRGRVRVAVTIGSAGPALAALTRSLGVPTVEAGELAAAVPAAAALARPGDTVLLAPACASMDQFVDYAERGRAFAAAVAALAERQEVAHGR
jgi:UDP-N-acetylmuramoylalanine--D-glutamate ligase